MAEAPRFDPEQLLRHDRLVRELARQLVGDQATAEDIAQQTWVAELTTPNEACHSVAGWLAGTVRRIVGKHVRSETVRRRHRSQSMLPPPAPATDEIVEREHARAAVVQAVMALPVGYRDVVLLRWFEGLPPREIARQLQLPVETVRTRCRRALDQLRAVLDAEHGGDRCSWVLLLLPLTTPSRAVVAATRTAMSTAMIWGGMGCPLGGGQAELLFDVVEYVEQAVACLGRQSVLSHSACLPRLRTLAQHGAHLFGNLGALE